MGFFSPVPRLFEVGVLSLKMTEARRAQGWCEEKVTCRFGG